jgi:peptidoglycan/LPS O-acetylase OafA/YrhL
MKSSQPAGALLPLDGLRGAGALLVLVFHFLSSIPYYGLPVPAAVMRISTFLCVLSIDVFFAASGFILMASLERIRAGTAGRNTHVAADFYLRRFFRIVPLWWLVITIELFRQHLTAGVYLANVTFAFGFLSFDPRYLPVLVAWSLFAEATFYAALPAVSRWVRGIGSAMLLFAVTVVLAHLWNRHAGALGIPSGNHFIDDFPLAVFKYFALGMLARVLQPRVAANRRPWLDAAAVAGVVVTAFTLRFATPATFLLLLAALTPGSRVARALAAGPLVFAGVHCYFIYLTHNQWFIEPMLDLVLRVLPRTPLTGWAGPWPALVAFALALALCVIAARISMKVFETPMMEWGRRLAGRARHDASRRPIDSPEAGRAA